MNGVKHVFSALLAGAVCAGGLSAEEKVAVWKGNGVADRHTAWIEPLNWVGSVVPGRYFGTDDEGNAVTNGTHGWTARFDRPDGNWICEFNGTLASVSNVVFSGDNATTHLGSGASHQLKLEEGGGLYVEESCRIVPTIEASIGCADDRRAEGNGVYVIRNDSPHGELFVKGGFCKFTLPDGVSWDYPTMQMEGKGVIRLGAGFSGNTRFRTYMNVAMDEGGRLIVTNTIKNFTRLLVPAGMPKQYVQIEPNSMLSPNAQANQQQLRAFSDLEISGEGTFSISTTTGFLYVDKGVTVDIKTPIVQHNDTGDATFSVRGGGTMRITGRNDVPQDISLYDGTTFEASKIGMAGEAGELGLGSAVRFYNGGVLRYAGAGETTDRGLVLLSGQGNVVQAGTGPLTVFGGISASKSGTTLVLSNDTEFPMTLSGTVAAANNPAIRKTGSGEVVLSGSNLSSGGITAEAGTLTVTSATALPKLTVSGSVVLKVAEGVEATVDLTYSSGSLDVRIGNGAKFKASGMSGLAPDWLTVNGATAKFSSDGSLVTMAGNDVEIAARGGVIPNAPDSVVGIVQDGDSGPVTLASASTRVIALNQEASVDAVVRFGEGEKLTVETITVKTNAAPLVLGDSAGTGALDVFGETLSIDAQDTNSLVVVRTGLAMDTAKTLCALGAGKVLLPDDFQWSGNLRIDAGTVSYTNATGALPSAALAGSGTFEIAGDADKTISGSNPGFTGKTVLCGGVNVVENPGFFGKSQSSDHTVTTTIQVKEGAELHVPRALEGRNIVLGGSGTDGTGALKLTGSDNMYWGCTGIELTSDTVITGLVSMGNAYFGILRWSTYRATVDMNGHKLTKAGNGRFLLQGGDVVNPGEIEIIGPSRIWMQNDFDLGPENSPPLVMSGNTTFASENIMPQRRPLVVNGGSLSFTSGQKNRNRRDIDVWKGPVTFTDSVSRLAFTLNGENSSSRFTLEGKVSGPGSMCVYYDSLGLLEILNPDNSGWTGALDIQGNRGGSVYAAYPASIPRPNLVTCEFTRVIAPMPNWTKADILDYANNADLKGSGFISVDTTSVEDGTVFSLADSDVTGDDFALAHDGGNSLALNITDGISKPIGLGSFNGTLKVSSPETLRLSRLVASSDSTNGCGRIVLDGAKDVRLAGTYESVRAGAAMHNRIKGDCGEIEIRNSLVRTDAELSSSPRICLGRYGSGLLKIGEGAVVTARVDFAEGSGGAIGAIWQTGGEICDYYAGVPSRDIGVDGAVYHEVRGGKASYNSETRMSLGGTMILGIYGGLMYIGETAEGAYPCLGSGGGFHLYVKGGTFRSKGESRTYLSRQSSDHKSSAFITVDGDDGYVDFCGKTLYMGGGTRSNDDGPVKAILNMNAGVLSASAIGRYPSRVDETVQRAYVNFNGGTYRLQGNTSFGVSDGYPTVPSRITVFEGGATIDTAGFTGAYSSAPFRKPTGNSVVSVPVPAEISSMELIAPPYIEIFDFNGEGDGATAYAELDTSTRRVSRVIVTSPGWDYSAPKAVFKLGGTVVCTNDCAVAPAVGGGFTKTGEGTYLLAATNTYSGATVVKGGTLKIKFAEALPSNTVVSLQGGTLDLNGCTVPVAKIIGDGGSIVNGSVSMEGLEYDIAAGECVTYGCPVAFASGAAVKLLNADSLDKDRRYVIAHFRGGVQNVPFTFEGLPEEVAAEWKLMLSGGFLKLYRPRGSVVVFR